MAMLWMVVVMVMVMVMMVMMCMVSVTRVGGWERRARVVNM
jgi:hypothetical protein